MQAIDDTTPLAPLWDRLRASFARAAVITGGAARIAAHVSLTARLRREIHGWIALLEHLVRKLLFAEAGRLAPPARPRGPQMISIALPAATHIAAGKSAPHSRRKTARADLQDPETWSVRFALAPPHDPRAIPDSRAPRIRALWGPSPPPPPPPPARPHVERHTPLNLARRFEALRRVLLDPAPYARRLADLMRRLVRRFPEAALRFASRSARVSHYDRKDSRLGVDCCVAAFDVLAAFDSS
jgi:hypothetical protein